MALAEAQREAFKALFKASKWGRRQIWQSVLASVDFYMALRQGLFGVVLNLGAATSRKSVYGLESTGFRAFRGSKSYKSSKSGSRFRRDVCEAQLPRASTSTANDFTPPKSLEVGSHLRVSARQRDGGGGVGQVRRWKEWILECIRFIRLVVLLLFEVELSISHLFL